MKIKVIIDTDDITDKEYGKICSFGWDDTWDENIFIAFTKNGIEIGSLLKGIKSKNINIIEVIKEDIDIDENGKIEDVEYHLDYNKRTTMMLRKALHQCAMNKEILQRAANKMGIKV